MQKYLEENKKKIKNEINQLKNNFNERCVDNMVEFFGDDFMMKKIKYDVLKKRNLLMENELKNMNIEMINIKQQMEKMTSYISKVEEKMNNDFIFKLETLKEEEDIRIQQNIKKNQNEVISNSLENFEGKLKRYEYDIRILKQNTNNQIYSNSPSGNITKSEDIEMRLNELSVQTRINGDNIYLFREQLKKSMEKNSESTNNFLKTLKRN